jgi:hypothetical protein
VSGVVPKGEVLERPGSTPGIVTKAGGSVNWGFFRGVWVSRSRIISVGRGSRGPIQAVSVIRAERQVVQICR